MIDLTEESLEQAINDIKAYGDNQPIFTPYISQSDYDTLIEFFGTAKAEEALKRNNAKILDKFE